MAQNSRSSLIPKFMTDALDTNFFTLKGAQISGWSVLHFANGVLFSLFVKNAWIALIVHTVWEIYQILDGVTDFSKAYARWDTLFDTILFMTGFFIGRNLFRSNF